MLADAHAARGDSARASTYLDRLANEPHEIPVPWYMMGRAYELLGDRTLALDYIERALEKGYDPYAIHQDPWLNDARSTLRYLELRDTYIQQN